MKFRQMLDNTINPAVQPIINALKELKFFANDTQFSTQQQISQRLKLFFTSEESKKTFLRELLNIIVQQISQDSNFFIKLKMLLLIHIIISSQIARSDFSKLLLNIKLSINTNSKNIIESKYGQICQQYYCYIYKLASQTTLINEELNKPQDDLMIYFTLSNQCYIGMNIQSLLESFLHDQNQLISNLVKFLYFDIQDIYIFILKDVKYLVEKSPHLIKNKMQLIELYKECQTLQDRMLEFYKFNMNFNHFNLIMPPHSIQIKTTLITQLTEEFNLQQLSTKQKENKQKLTHHQIKSIDQIPETISIHNPLTSKNAQSKKFNFPIDTKRPVSPTESNTKDKCYFGSESTGKKQKI